MKSWLALAAIILFFTLTNALELDAQLNVKPSIHVFLAVNNQSKPTTTFTSDVITIYAFWRGEGFEIGDKIRAVWFAEDVGDAEPKHSKILEADFRVLKHNEVGSFSLSRPTGKIWPTGKYAVEFYLNDNLAEIVRFTITPGAKIEMH